MKHHKLLGCKGRQRVSRLPSGRGPRLGLKGAMVGRQSSRIRLNEAERRHVGGSCRRPLNLSPRSMVLDAAQAALKGMGPAVG